MILARDDNDTYHYLQSARPARRSRFVQRSALGGRARRGDENCRVELPARVLMRPVLMTSALVHGSAMERNSRDLGAASALDIAGLSCACAALEAPKQ